MLSGKLQARRRAGSEVLGKQSMSAGRSGNVRQGGGEALYKHAYTHCVFIYMGTHMHAHREHAWA